MPFDILKVKEVTSNASPITEGCRYRTFMRSRWHQKIMKFTTHELYNEIGRANKERIVNLYLQIKRRIPIEYDTARLIIDNNINKIMQFKNNKDFVEFALYKHGSEYSQFLDHLPV